MATIQNWQTNTLYYVGDLVIDNNTLYKLEPQSEYTNSKTYKVNDIVQIEIPAGVTKVTFSGMSPSDYAVVSGKTILARKASSNTSDLNEIFGIGAFDWQLVLSTTTFDRDKPYWQRLGTFAQEDAATLENFNTNLLVKNVKGNYLLILNPEQFSATIFRRLLDKVESIEQADVKERLKSFITFQKDGLVDRNTNTRKRLRVTPTAPFAVPGIIDIPLGKTRVFSYGNYNPRDMKDTATYTFKGVVERQNPSNPNEYLVDASTILLKTKEGKWIEKFMGKTGVMEDLVNADNSFYQHKDFWKTVRGLNGSILVRVQKKNFSKWTPRQKHYLRSYFEFIRLISSTEDLNLSMARDRKYLDDTLIELQRLFERPTLNYAGKPERDLELKHIDVHSPFNVNIEDIFLHGERKLVVSFQAIEDFTYEIELIANPPTGTPVYRSVKGSINGKAQLVEHIKDDTITSYSVKVRAASGSTHTRDLSRPHVSLAPSIPPWDEVNEQIYSLRPINQEQKDKLRNNFVMSLYDVDKLRVEIEGKFKTLWDYEASNPVKFDPFPMRVDPSDGKLKPIYERYKWDDILDVPSNWNQLTKKQKIHVIVYNAYEEAMSSKRTNLRGDLLDSFGDSRLRQYMNMNDESLKLKEDKKFDVFRTKFASSGLTYQGLYDATRARRSGGYSENDAVRLNDGTYFKLVRRNGALRWEKIYQPLSLTERVNQTYPINYVNQNKRETYSGTLNTLLSGEKSRSIFQKMDATFMLSLDFRKKISDYEALLAVVNTKDWNKIRKSKVLQSLPCVQLDLSDEKKECARLRQISLCLRKSTEAGYPVVVRHPTNAFDSAYSDTRSHMRSRRWTQGVLWERTDKEPGTLIIPGTQRMGRLLDTTKRQDGVLYMNNESVMQDLLGTGPVYDIANSSGMNGPALVKVRESSGAKIGRNVLRKKGMLQHPLYPSRTKARAQILINQGGLLAESAIPMSDPLVTDVAAYSADVNPVVDIEL